MCHRVKIEKELKVDNVYTTHYMFVFMNVRYRTTRLSKIY